MGLEELEQNIERMGAALDYYQELLKEKAAHKDEAKTLTMKKDFTKEQILKFTLATKKLLQEMEKKL